MSAEITVFILLLIALATAFVVRGIDAKAAQSDEAAERWAEAVRNENSQLGRILIGAARPVSSLSAVRQQSASPTYAALENKLLGAGGLFGRSVEVFLSVQILCMFIGGLALTALLLTGASGMALVGGTLFSVCFAAYPYNLISQKAKKQAEAVATGLPEFAELLQMPLSSGVGVRAALRFTAERLDGPVAATALALLSNLSSRTMSDEDAFDLAGKVLGTPESAAFFTALKQADQEGAKVSDTLAKQAEALRVLAYQQTRAANKKLPVKVLLVFFIHLLPLLLVIALVPTIYSLTGL